MADAVSHTDPEKLNPQETQLPHAESPSASQDEEKAVPSTTNTYDTQDATKDENIVDWDGPGDPHNPCNWASKAKVANTLLIIILCFLTPLGSSMFASGVPDVLRDFNSRSETLAEFVVSIYVLGYAVGPLLIALASETYGRYPVYVVCNIVFLMWHSSSSSGSLLGVSESARSRWVECRFPIL